MLRPLLRYNIYIYILNIEVDGSGFAWSNKCMELLFMNPFIADNASNKLSVLQHDVILCDMVFSGGFSVTLILSKVTSEGMEFWSSKPLSPMPKGASVDITTLFSRNLGVGETKS